MRKNILIIALISLGVPAISLQAEDKINFEKQIYPFIRSGCVTCHQPEYEYESRGRMRPKKPKADIVMTSPETIKEAKDEDGNPILVPGKPDESRMLQVTKLPLDDDMHFPPDGKAPQWTDAEKELFAKWIEEGADFGGWEGDKNLPYELPENWEEKAPGTTETAE